MYAVRMATRHKRCTARPSTVTVARVLLVPDGASWTLPHFTPAVTDFRRVRHINEHMREQYGLESVVQRCVAHRYDPVSASPWCKGVYPT